jgi:hypothetical protein
MYYFIVVAIKIKNYLILLDETTKYFSKKYYFDNLYKVLVFLKNI